MNLKRMVARREFEKQMEKIEASLGLHPLGSPEDIAMIEAANKVVSIKKNTAL